MFKRAKCVSREFCQDFQSEGTSRSVFWEWFETGIVSYIGVEECVKTKSGLEGLVEWCSVVSVDFFVSEDEGFEIMDLKGEEDSCVVAMITIKMMLDLSGKQDGGGTLGILVHTSI